MRVVTGLMRAVAATPDARRLGIVRILLGAYVLWYVGSRTRMLSRVSRTDPGLFAPVGVATPLRRPLPPRVVMAGVGVVLASGTAFTLGWRHRITGPLFSGSLLALLSYRNSWSMIFHSDNVMALHAIVLGVAPAADALSLDAARAGAAGRVMRVGPRGEWEYRWPIALMNGLTVSTYLLAAIAKLKGPSGWRWVSGESLRRQIASDGVRKGMLGSEPAPMAVALWRHEWLFRLAGVGSMAIELGAPIALLHHRLGHLWALSALGMHWGIYFLMGIKFRYQQSGLIFAPFFDFERVLRALLRR